MELGYKASPSLRLEQYLVEGMVRPCCYIDILRSVAAGCP